MVGILDKLDALFDERVWSILGIAIWIIGISLILTSNGNGGVTWVGIFSAVIGAGIFKGIPQENKLLRVLLRTPIGVIMMVGTFIVVIYIRMGSAVLADTFIKWGFGFFVFGYMLSEVFSTWVED